MKNKFYTVINILGLSIGLGAALVILSYVRNELSYDTWNENSNRIIRVSESIKDDEGKFIDFASTSSKVLSSLEGKVSGLTAQVRILPIECFVTRDGQNRFLESNFIFADSTISSIFTFEVVEGDLEKSLKDPFGITLTETAATKYFGSDKAVGQQLVYEAQGSKQEFNVHAVIRGIPENSHFDFQLIASLKSLETVMPWYDNWYFPPTFTYGLISDPEKLPLVENTVNEVMQASLPEWEKGNRTYQLQPLLDIHLHSHLENEWEANNRYEYIMIFMVIAVFILLIACINFINLSTSKSIQRSREVGVRKVLGASRRKLVLQYLGESLLTTVLSFVLALAITEWILLVLFESIVGVSLTISFLWLWPNWIATLSLILFISVLAGFYPAIVLSRFQPEVVLRGRSKTNRESNNLRKSLVIFQFTVSSLLIAGTLIVLDQTNFLRDTELGFEKDLIVSMQLNDDQDQLNAQKLKDQISPYNFVDGVTICSQLPIEGSPYDNPVMPENSNKEGGYNLFTLAVDPDFPSVFDMEILEGRDFSIENEADLTSTVLINESAAKRFGWTPAESIGKNVELTWYSNGAELRPSTVVGVLKDFHFNTLHHQIEPLILYVNNHQYYTSQVAVKFKRENISEAVSFLTEQWKIFSPDRPIDLKFLDQELEKSYVFEAKATKILKAFTGFAIFISCLGLLGLSAYTAESKKKEIGVRKVMGASVNSILTLLSKEFLIIVLISNLIAIPIGLWLAKEWLNTFAYKINISILSFLFALGVGLVVGVLTITFQSLGAAMTNPVNSLRDE